MSFKTWGDYADTVTDEFVKEICPEAWAALMGCIEYADLDIDAVAYGLDTYGGYDALDGVDEESEKEIRTALNDLIKTFGEKTDLLLEIRFMDNGDDVGEFFWGVEKVYQLTPAGKKLKDKITRKEWLAGGF